MQLEEVVQITPLVKRITAGNSSVFTGPGTNTYIVGNGEDLTVVDPGPALSEHIKAIVSCSSNLSRIVVTHTHPDHSPGVSLLQNKVNIPAYGLLTETTKSQDPSFKPKKMLTHGEVIEAKDHKLEVIHTPGHASNHLCFLLKEEKLLFTGDHIMNGSTVVIVPPDGNMQDYLDSLRKLKEYDLENIAPGHGELLSNPHSVAEWIINHRLEREEKVIEAIKKATTGNPDTLVEEVYDDVDTTLFPIAKWSLEAHLIKLQNEERVIKEGNQFIWKDN
uniref:Zn-dependent hydrolases, including glyoxylases n=1 Tax=uncultured gamma proteobacterium HF0770_40P16 TaxID=723580 RepID=E7C7S6_9GAMM|nr:Zn-dependent hydrolases, including glyoxylases [uncultured gamma proteobacterium HF0770_40P16]